MPSGMYFFKFEVGAHGNKKLRALTDCQFRLLTHIWALAQESSDPGVVQLAPGLGIDPPDLAAGAGCRAGEDPVEMLRRLCQLTLIDIDGSGVIKVHDWDEHNGRKPSDEPSAIAQRVRRHRTLKHADVTPCNALHPPNVTPPELEQERELEKEKCAEARARATSELWPRQVYERLQAVLGVDDLDPGWQRFIGDCVRDDFPVEARVAGAEQFLRERHPPGECGPPYVLAIIRRMAKAKARNGPPVIDWTPPSPERAAQVTRELEQAERELAERRRALPS